MNKCTLQIPNTLDSQDFSTALPYVKESCDPGVCVSSNFVSVGNCG